MRTTTHRARSGALRETRTEWRERTRVVVSPVAAPAVLGMFAFMAAALTIGGYMAGWYGARGDARYLAPFVLAFGLAEFLAGMWAYKSRDTWGTAFHGIWGAGFAALGAVALLVPAASMFRLPVTSPSFGFVFLPLAGVAGSLALTGVFANVVRGGVAALAAAAAILGSIGLWAGSGATANAGGWLFVAAAALAWLAATMLSARGAARRRLMPLVKLCAAGMPRQIPSYDDGTGSLAVEDPAA
jgi:succinate-acetate transporter protein